MLNMLPKFELVPMMMYFMMLAKLRRPSITPSFKHAEVLLQQDDVGGVLGHVHAVHHRDADIGGVQRGRVVDPVAHEPDHLPARFERE